MVKIITPLIEYETSGGQITNNGVELDEAKDYIQVVLSKPQDPIVTGFSPSYWVVPESMELTDLMLSTVIAPSGSSLVMKVYRNGSSILSTDISILPGTNNSDNNGTSPFVISQSTLNRGDVITFEVTQVGSSTAGTDLSITLYYSRL